MKPVVAFVLEQIQANNKDIVLPKELKRPGMGTTHALAEHFDNEEYDFQDIRAIYLLVEDVEPQSLIGSDGIVRYAHPWATLSFTNPGAKTRIIILDEFDQAAPGVQAVINEFIHEATIANKNIFFIKR